MITVGRLLDLDVMAYVFVGIAVIGAVLYRLCARQGKHQAAEDAAVDRWRAGGTGD